MDTITCTCDDGLWCEPHLLATEDAYRGAFRRNQLLVEAKS